MPSEEMRLPEINFLKIVWQYGEFLQGSFLFFPKIRVDVC